MIHLSKIEFTKDFLGFNPGQAIVLSNVNLLVGDQGSGKSSLLTLLAKNGQDNGVQKVSFYMIGDTKVESFFFDSELMNPRTRHFNDSYDETKDIARAIEATYKSHGEAMRQHLLKPLAMVENAIVMLDEPESGLSLKSQKVFADIVDEASETRNCQFIISAHSQYLIERYHRVYNMENQRWTTARSFIKSQLNDG